MAGGARQIADGSLDPAAGTHLVRDRIAYGLDAPEELEPRLSLRTQPGWLRLRLENLLRGTRPGSGQRGEQVL
ncbi:hypothetical protein ABZV20_39070, partial [Streptomyces decoyicus]